MVSKTLPKGASTHDAPLENVMENFACHIDSSDCCYLHSHWIGRFFYRKTIHNNQYLYATLHKFFRIKGSGIGSNQHREYDQLKWTDNAHLVLTFDNEFNSATSTIQEGVRWFYWAQIPGVNIDFEHRQYSFQPGYMMVFMALEHPTFTNYSSVKVVGGGIPTTVLASSPAGATIRAMGDMRGRTIDIKFSKNPIPLD